jgi:hypothetical protein
MQVASILQAVRRPCSDSRDVPALVVPVSAPAVPVERSWFESAAVSAGARRLLEAATIPQVARRPCSDSPDVPALLVLVLAVPAQRSWFESAAVSAGA